MTQETTKELNIYHEHALAVKEIKLKEKQIRALKAHIVKLSQKSPLQDTVKLDENTEISEKTKEKSDEKVHFFHWQAYCPECETDEAGKNPDFKDELRCSTCGMHLGSLENVKTMKRCPSCASTKYKKVKNDE